MFEDRVPEPRAASRACARRRARCACAQTRTALAHTLSAFKLARVAATTTCGGVLIDAVLVSSSCSFS